jgi:transcriptional regulator with XRE-family HTH domain
MKNEFNIGKKIYELRTEKLMTQSDLAGDFITRNMLSSIEHGTALPSLPTVIYLASRLNVPVGYLLADEKEERFYNKMQNFSEVKGAYSSGEYRICKQICLEKLDASDDEVNLLLAECSLRIAIEHFERGELHAACRELDEALAFSRKTAYSTEHIKSTADVYFTYLSHVSSLLYSNDEGDDSVGDDVTGGFADFARAYESFLEGDLDSAGEYVASVEDKNAPYASFMSALLLEESGDFMGAREKLIELLDSDNILGDLMLYNVFEHLEKCSRECDDYKSAYEYANSKMRMYERLLEG